MIAVSGWQDARKVGSCNSCGGGKLVVEIEAGRGRHGPSLVVRCCPKCLADLASQIGARRGTK